jgi:hypothetical protein
MLLVSKLLQLVELCLENGRRLLKTSKVFYHSNSNNNNGILELLILDSGGIVAMNPNGMSFDSAVQEIPEMKNDQYHGNLGNRPF